MATADIVIVNWNSGELLRRCVDSVGTYGAGAVAKVIVIDNGSVDGSASLNASSLQLEVILTGQNLGFGRACNIGAKQGQAPYILLLNPDAELRGDALPRAIGFMEQPEAARVGVTGIRLVGDDGHLHRHCARFPTWRNFIGNSLGLTRILRHWFPPMLMDEFDHRSSRPVDHVMGAFYLIRRELYEKLGGFDERFFVYLEDLDLSRRVADAGYSIHYLAEAEAYHKQGGVSEKVKAHRLFYALTGNLVYSFKHLPRPAALGVAAVTLLIEPISRSGRALFRRSLEELVFTWKGFGMLYGSLPDLWRTLRTIGPAAHRNAGDGDGR